MKVRFLVFYLIGVFVAYGTLYGSSEKCSHWTGNFVLSLICCWGSWVSVIAALINGYISYGIGFKLW